MYQAGKERKAQLRLLVSSDRLLCEAAVIGGLLLCQHRARGAQWKFTQYRAKKAG
jgi:hypothetical protein